MRCTTGSLERWMVYCPTFSIFWHDEVWTTSSNSVKEIGTTSYISWRISSVIRVCLCIEVVKDIPVLHRYIKRDGPAQRGRATHHLLPRVRCRSLSDGAWSTLPQATLGRRVQLEDVAMGLTSSSPSEVQTRYTSTLTEIYSFETESSLPTSYIQLRQHVSYIVDGLHALTNDLVDDTATTRS
jgi:hypothetical protein